MGCGPDSIVGGPGEAAVWLQRFAPANAPANIAPAGETRHSAIRYCSRTESSPEVHLTSFPIIRSVILGGTLAVAILLTLSPQTSVQTEAQD